ncbi:MAG: phage holin family protein [Pseudomonadota bacterium]
MNAATHAASPEQGLGSLLVSMAGTRLELAALDLQANLERTFASLMVSFVAVVIALIAFAFIGVAVIVIYWDTHRVLAAVATTAGYLALAVVFGSYARALWNSRPAVFAAALRQLELDREALRGLR